MQGTNGPLRILWLAGLALVLVVALVASPLFAQSSKSAKEADKLEQSGETARDSVEDVLEHLGSMLTLYNAIIDGSAKNPQSSYKKLAGDLKGAERKIKGARKDLASMNKSAEKFFQAWEADIASISSEDQREESTNQLTAARERHDALGDTLDQADEAFAPLLDDFRDQVLYLGYDLSPEAIADLSEETADFNALATDTIAKVKAMLEGTGEVDSPLGDAATAAADDDEG